MRLRTVKELSQAGAPAVPALLQALGDGDRDVRVAVCEALGKIGDTQAIPALRQVARIDEYSQVRDAARKAIEKIREKHQP